MRYLLAVIDTGTNTARPNEMAEIDAFNNGLRDCGYWVMAAGLVEPTRAAVIDNRDGAGQKSDGPLHRTTEYMSGFWIVDVPDHSTALQVAADGSRACNRKVEVRPFIER